MKLYNIENKYLYEILDNYKTLENKDEIFTSFMNLIFKSKNHRQVVIRHIKYKILEDKIDTDIGQIFTKYQNVPYTYSKTRTKELDFINLIRQKVNNIYNNYCEKRICTRKDYMDLLKYPKQLYYQWINNELDIPVNDLDNEIQNSLNKAEELKVQYAKHKMVLSWKDYKLFVTNTLKKAFDNFISLDDFENKNTIVLTVDDWNEDNFCIKYLCKCLDYGIRDFQKEYYGLYRKGKRSKLIYSRCSDCGNMFWSKKQASKTYRCDKCQKLADYSPIETKTIICIDCGKEVEVNSKDNYKNRCEECYTKYRREYKRKNEQKRRLKIKEK